MLALLSMCRVRIFYSGVISLLLWVTRHGTGLTIVVWFRSGTWDLNAASTPAIVPWGTVHTGATLASCNAGYDVSF